ncbi:DMT family transporter [Aquimarina sp. Aq107]|uniref:DMT family transporter n=1 Tax=Aquimarina sp. Aq107 TaxID=1191912 RepID=UPI000D556853|nr:DMT family transporter [Aquimarina sp. Aq107]
MKQLIFPILLAFAAGAFVPIQTGANALLGKNLGSGMLSTLVVFVVATLSTALFIAFQRPTIPNITQLSAIPLYAWVTGGILGAAYIYLLIYTAPKLGMAGVVGFVVSGQLIAAMLFDHFGWMGFEQHSINWKRFLGALLLITGVLIIKKY